MGARKSHDVVATVGTFKKDGVEKKRYSTVGAAFTDDESGRISIKLDTVPVSPEWSGWLSLYPADENRGGRQESQQESPRRESRPPAPRPAPEPEDDDIPF